MSAMGDLAAQVEGEAVDMAAVMYRLLSEGYSIGASGTGMVTVSVARYEAELRRTVTFVAAGDDLYAALASAVEMLLTARQAS